MEIESVLANFNRKGFKAHFFKTPDDLRAFLAKNLNATTIGMGGSMTIAELGLIDFLSAANKVNSHSIPTSEDAINLAAASESYMLSANALTSTGEIINIDGRGNRVSASIFGVNLKRVFFICGTNKIADSLESAIWRAKNIAAPKNAKRLNRKTPCAIKGDKCYNCQSPERICRVTTIMTNPLFGIETYVLILDGSFGY